MSAHQHFSQIQHVAKHSCKVLLYVIDASTRAVASMVEVFFSLCPRVVVCMSVAYFLVRPILGVLLKLSQLVLLYDCE